MRNILKKSGFTLMEVLIALAIVGLVASMTIPTFVANSQQQALRATQRATVTDVENAMTTMLVAEEAPDLLATNFYASLAGATKGASGTSLGNHLKIVKTTTSKTDIYKAPRTAPVAANVDEEGNDISVDCLYQLKNGAVLLIKENYVNDDIGTLWIDANGTDLPNRIGVDTEEYTIHIDGTLERVEE